MIKDPFVGQRIVSLKIDREGLLGITHGEIIEIDRQNNYKGYKMIKICVDNNNSAYFTYNHIVFEENIENIKMIASHLIKVIRQEINK